MSDDERLGRLPLEGIKALARVKLKEHPAILKQFENLPDYWPTTSANIDKVIMYWELLTDALAEK